ncbi:hypothetical protein MOK15_04410 [Sphingobium sp. BYY-5]|uniref:hypothetical protein n=1 Tax=Sphingobium sp. BYY-5 TaxID=2926400 RepID=UPI001FA6CB86|nr:hypothetical protein [Sphingobium sp. BYY-5]MCI4589338.1 hypothetical protein [Sphingobium sp. BYY-5]
MKTIMLAGAALLSFTTITGIAVAQDMPAPSSQPPADPNASVPTGAVPPDTGMVPAPADVPDNPSAPVGSAANPVTVGGNMTPPPTEAKDYPVCSKAVQDSCINPGDARKGHHSAVGKKSRKHH